MDFELISPSEFDALPHDDDQCFVESESICRRNMTRMMNEDTNRNFDRAIQAQYMASVASVALECGLKHLYVDLPATNDDNFYQDFSKFSLAVQGEVARVRIRGRKSRNSVSVHLTDKTRTKIEHYVVRLRDIIDKSDLPAARKSSMHGKLNELTEELEKQRLNLGKTMAVLSMVLVTLAAATTIAAEGPSAVTHIMELIGADKESEDAALSRLAPPPKALPAPPQKPSATPPKPRRPVLSQTADLDDDIPF